MTRLGQYLVSSMKGLELDLSQTGVLTALGDDGSIFSSSGSPAAGLTVFNVVTYGAVGDGVTDNTSALQTAQNACAVAGGILYFPPGVYLTQGLIVDSLVNILGAGYEASIIKLKNNTPTSIGITGDVLVGRNFVSLSSAPYGGSGSSTSVAGINSWSIRNITIDGNVSNQSTGQGGAGIRVYGYGWAIDSIRVRKCKTNAFISDWGTTSPAGNAPDSMEAFLGNSKFHECADGVLYNGPHDSIMYHLQSYGHTSGAIGFNIAPSAVGMLLTHCHPWAFSGQPLSIGYKIQGVGCTIIGGQAEGHYTGGVGVQILASNTVIKGLSVYTNATPTGRGIQVGSITPSVAVSSCIIDVLGSKCTEGPIDYQNGTYNTIKAVWYSPGVNMWTANKPGSSDTLDIVNTGGGASSSGSIFAPVPFYGGGIGVGAQIVIMQKAGTPVDGDFLFTPLNGTIAVDTTNSKLYVRIGGTWKGVVVT